MTKHECRSTKEAEISNDAEGPVVLSELLANHLPFLRHSSFGFHHCEAGVRRLLP